MVLSNTVVKWRLILYFLRLPFLIVNAYLYDTQGWLTSFSLNATGHLVKDKTGNIAAVATLICGCINDLYMLTWDIYTYGSFFAHPIFQILISLAFIPLLILEMMSICGLWAEITPQMSLAWLLSAIALLLIDMLILAMTAVFWIQNSSWLWGCRTRHVRWTQTFGTKRPTNDEVWRLVRKVIKRLPHWLKNIIYRRIVDMESKGHAMAQNITAVILLSLLVAQTVVAIHGVVYENFDTREVWRVPEDHPSNFCRFNLTHGIDPNKTWNLFAKPSSSADHVASIVPSAPVICDDSILPGILNCQPMDSICGGMVQADILDIAMITNIPDHNASSPPERIWMLYTWDIYPYNPYNITSLYDHGIHFMPGYQLLGLVTLAERRIIRSYFTDMWGFKPRYFSHYVIPSIDWMQRTPLNNESVAWVTLEFNTPERYNQDEKLIRVIEDYRQHNFLSALSSIGGLLSVLQGLHILCFGKPLFWGMFGSKLLDPFGIFASGSRTLRQRMAARYGFDMESRTFSAEGLSLFLRDFVLDIGPLNKGDDDDEEDSHVENENEECPAAAGETQAYDAMSLGVAGDEDGRVENEEYPPAVGETWAYDAIPLGVVGDLEDNRRSIHVGNV